jgi:hypothetical protein
MMDAAELISNPVVTDTVRIKHHELKSKLDQHLDELILLVLTKHEQDRSGELQKKARIPSQTKTVPRCCGSLWGPPVDDYKPMTEELDEKSIGGKKKITDEDIVRLRTELWGSIDSYLNAQAQENLSSSRFGSVRMGGKPVGKSVRGRIPSTNLNDMFISPTRTISDVDKVITKKTAVLRDALYDYGSFLTKVKDEATVQKNVIPDNFKAEIEMIRNKEDEECFDFLVQTNEAYMEIMFVTKASPMTTTSSRR